MIGETVGHYEILEKLGSGGMGEVWLAEDTRLERQVALKFLPAEAITEEEQTRFIREAKTASALDHPNICTIHEVNETDKGKTFIAMAYCDGETVKEKISQGPLELEEALDIAIQIGEGLARAHQEGIVHRDIKPANAILTRDGTVKIVDFGLAKLSGATQLTKTGTSMGTAAYMSPEQVRGEEVDHRTDIWALGVVLYEMATGQLPFQGENDTAVIYSVLNDDPEILSSIRQDIPQDLEEVVGKALVKDPANRYQDVQEMVEEIRNLPIGDPGQQEWGKSIIVLPFEDISPDKDNEFFSDGLTEEIITDLSQIHDLLVVSRSSAMTFKGKKKKVKEIAREVHVRYVLEGSVRKAGDDLRITAQLIDSKNDSHLWAEKYKGTLDDIFDIQEKVSRAIVESLRVTLTEKEDELISIRAIEDAQAYECHLRAIYNIWLTTEDALERALQYVNSGLEIIGDNEILYTDKGQVYIHYVDFVVGKDESYLQKAEQCVQEIFALNPDSARGHFLNGLIIRNRGNPQEAVKEFKKAIEVYPKDPNYLLWLSWVYGHSGQCDAARPLSDRFLEIDPLSPVAHMGIVDLFEGKFKTAARSLKRCNQLEEGNPFYRFWYAKSLAYDLSVEEAVKMFDLIVEETPNTIWAQLSSFFIKAHQGNKSEALESVNEETKQLFRNDEMFPIWMAESYALLDEKEEAIKWLEYGLNWGFINFPFLNEYNPFLENIRGETGFKKLMERVKHEWENFEV